tara:strand:- start:4 stop:222 length:219 start_codon:yes stop_codon:yes gene_type:complete
MEVERKFKSNSSDSLGRNSAQRFASVTIAYRIVKNAPMSYNPQVDSWKTFKIFELSFAVKLAINTHINQKIQ